MALNTSKCNHLPPLPFKGLIRNCVLCTWLATPVQIIENGCFTWICCTLQSVIAYISLCGKLVASGLQFRLVGFSSWNGGAGRLAQLRKHGLYYRHHHRRRRRVTDPHRQESCRRHEAQHQTIHTTRSFAHLPVITSFDSDVTVTYSYCSLHLRDKTIRHECMHSQSRTSWYF